MLVVVAAIGMPMNTKGHKDERYSDWDGVALALRCSVLVCLCGSNRSGTDREVSCPRYARHARLMTQSVSSDRDIL